MHDVGARVAAARRVIERTRVFDARRSGHPTTPHRTNAKLRTRSQDVGAYHGSVTMGYSRLVSWSSFICAFNCLLKRKIYHCSPGSMYVCVNAPGPQGLFLGKETRDGPLHETRFLQRIVSTPGGTAMNSKSRTKRRLVSPGVTTMKRTRSRQTRQTARHSASAPQLGTGLRVVAGETGAWIDGIEPVECFFAASQELISVDGLQERAVPINSTLSDKKFRNTGAMQ